MGEHRGRAKWVWNENASGTGVEITIPHQQTQRNIIYDLYD